MKHKEHPMAPTPIPYLFFDGTCAEAITTYADIFGSAAPDLFLVKDSPMAAHLPPAAHGKVMHAALQVGDGWIYGADDIEGGTPAMAGTSLSISFPTAEAARAIFDRLAEGGEVRMPFAAQFFTPGMGALTDRFGTRWMVLTDDPNRPSA